MRKWMALALVLALCACAPALAEGENLLVNGSVDDVSASGFPTGWSQEVWFTDPSVSTLSVESDGVEGTCLCVHSASVNDARWAQTVTVQPDTIYRFSAMVRAEGIGEDGYGANLSISGLGVYSDMLYDTGGDWVELSITGRTGEDQTSVTVYARIGGYGDENLNTGTAWFDDLSLVELSDAEAGDVVYNFYASTDQSDWGEADEAAQEEPERYTEELLLGMFGYVLAVVAFARKARSPLAMPKKRLHWALGGVLLAALVVRLILAARIRGYNTDIACFEAWSERMASVGPLNFYAEDYFCDYPPGYMLLLAPIALLRQVFGFAYDFTAHGGSLSETNAAKIVKVQQLALKNGAPVIALNDSGGARIQEGVNSLAGYASIFYQNTIASGVIPQISAILGPCAGGACYSPALTDFIFMVKEQSHMFITGPDVVKTVTHEEVDKEELGGAYTHSSKSGVTHFMCNTEEETLMSIRELLSFLPSNNMEDAPFTPCSDDIHRRVEALQTVIPEDPNMPYDIKDIIEPVLDNQYFFEVMPHFAKNVVIGFGRLNGRSVGIVANQPAYLAGVLDIDASDKAARFIRFCDCFNIPLITFEDVPGFLPGTMQEHNGIIRHGAKIVYAYAEATVPKITLITRKAYGGAYIVMSSKPTGADVNLAYPQAEIAVMGAEGAVNILYRKSSAEEKQEIIKEYEDKFSNPYRAAERGLIDEVIMPRDTRYKLVQALEMAHNKNQSNPPKKHGNMPL